MAVWSAVRFSELSEDLRLDAEFYRPKVLALRAAIHNAPYSVKTIAEASESVINFGAYSLCNNITFQEFEERDKDSVEFITAQDIQDGFIDIANARWVPQDQHKQLLWKSQVKTGQVLVAMAARLGHAAVYDEKKPLNSRQDIAKITVADADLLDPYYLATYINSSVGRELLLAAQTGSVQQHTNLGRIKNLAVVIAPQATQQKIARLYRRALQMPRSAAVQVAAAEDLLVKALGLDKLDLSPRLFYARSFSDLIATQRFDAEYFSPRYQRVLQRLGKDGLSIGSVASPIKNRFQSSRFNRSEIFRYIEIGALTGDGQAEAVTLEVAEAPSRAQWIVRPGDVITSTVRPIRRLSAIITQEQDGVVCSSGFAVLRANAGSIEPEVLLTYLRLPVICEILDLHTTASMYPAIPTDRLLRIPIVLPKQSVPNELVAKVRNSYAARRESRRLLDRAKTEVEGLILGTAKE